MVKDGRTLAEGYDALQYCLAGCVECVNEVIVRTKEVVIAIMLRSIDCGGSIHTASLMERLFELSSTVTESSPDDALSTRMVPCTRYMRPESYQT